MKAHTVYKLITKHFLCCDIWQTFADRSGGYLRSLIDCDLIWWPAPETIYEERHWIEVVPCLLTIFDWYCHLYIMCLLRQIFLA